MGKWIKSYELVKPRLVKILDAIRMIVGIAVAFLPLLEMEATEADGFSSGFSKGFVVGFVMVIFLFFDSLIDFFVFAGISSGRKKGMELIMSSFEGRTFVSSALKGEAFLRFVKLLVLGVFLAFPGNLFNFSGSFNEMIFILALILLIFSSTNFTLMLTRKVGLTMLVHWLISYGICTVVIGLIAGAMGFVEGSEVFETGAFSGGILILLIVSVLLAAGSSVLLIGVNNKGFAKSYIS